MAPQRDSRMKDSALLRAGLKVSEVAIFVGVSHITIYAIEKRMDNSEGVNRRAGSGSLLARKGDIVYFVPIPRRHWVHLLSEILCLLKN